MEISSLKVNDEPSVRLWLIRYLEVHLQWWSDSLDLNWNHEAIADNMEQNHLVDKAWARIVDASKKPYAWVRTARTKKKLVGIIHSSIELDDLFGYKIGHIHWIYVSEKYRNRGIGQALMKLAQAWLKKQNPIGIELYVNRVNDGARGLYQKLGYEVSDNRMLLTLR